MSPKVNLPDETTPAEMDYALAPSEHGSAKRVPPGSTLRESSRIRRGAFGGRQASGEAKPQSTWAQLSYFLFYQNKTPLGFVLLYLYLHCCQTF